MVESHLVWNGCCLLYDKSLCAFNWRRNDRIKCWLRWTSGTLWFLCKHHTSQQPTYIYTKHIHEVCAVRRIFHKQHTHTAYTHNTLEHTLFSYIVSRREICVCGTLGTLHAMYAGQGNMIDAICMLLYIMDVLWLLLALHLTSVTLAMSSQLNILAN